MDCAFRSSSSCSVLSVSLNPSQSLLVFSTVLSCFLPAIWLRTLSNLLVAGVPVVLMDADEAAVIVSACELAAVDAADEIMCFGRAMDVYSMSSNLLFLLPFAAESVCKAVAADEDTNVEDVAASVATILVVSIAAGL